MASLPALAEEPEAHHATPTLAVVMDFDGQYSPESLEEMERELESVLRPCSLAIQWRILDESTPKESFSNLVVARFKGDCRNEQAADPVVQTSTLGLTHVSEGEILPFSEVDCDRVRRFVQPQIGHDAGPHADRLLGRALGRVLAHELYHILAKTKDHARRGLAKAMLTPRDLLVGRAQFEPGQADSIVRGLRPVRPFTHRAAAGK